MKWKMALMALGMTVASSRAVTCIGNLSDINDNAYTPDNAVRFIPKLTPLANGQKTVMDIPRSVRVTNGLFTVNLVGGLYDFDAGPPNAKIVILAPPNDTNSYTLNELAALATNVPSFLLTNWVGQISQRILPGSGLAFTTNNVGLPTESITITATGGGGGGGGGGGSGQTNQTFAGSFITTTSTNGGKDVIVSVDADALATNSPVSDAIASAEDSALAALDATNTALLADIASRATTNDLNEASINLANAVAAKLNTNNATVFNLDIRGLRVFDNEYSVNGGLVIDTTDGDPAGGADFYGNFIGYGAGLTNLNASYLSGGLLPGARLQGTYSLALNFSNPANLYSGVGSNLTFLNAGQLAYGTVPWDRLPTLLWTNNSESLSLRNSELAEGWEIKADDQGDSGLLFTNANTGSGVYFTDSGEIQAPLFNGSGSLLTSLNASALSSGTVPFERLPYGVLTNGGIMYQMNWIGGGSFEDGSTLSGNPEFTGSPVFDDGDFSGFGAGLTGLKAAHITAWSPTNGPTTMTVAFWLGPFTNTGTGLVFWIPAVTNAP